MELCKSEQCTGCAACCNICTRNAIKMISDDEGFLRPEIMQDMCIDCGACQRVCPSFHPPEKSPGNVYAAFTLDQDLRLSSSSGGIFTLLAKNTLKKNGVVFGAAYTEDFQIHQIPVFSESDLSKLRGSKYAQSEVGDSYSQVKAFLKEGRPVFYTGTPCQIAGLRTFLGKDEPLLLTMDLVCHGVPSPAVLRKHLDSIENSSGKKMTDINMRCKDTGWKTFSTKYTFSDGTEQKNRMDSFMKSFLQDLILRPSCYQCPFACEERVGDITIGDYWGYRESAPEYIEDDDYGISVVKTNTQKGMIAFRKIKRKIALANRTMEDAIRGNKVFTKPAACPTERSRFWDEYRLYSWDELSDRWFPARREWLDPISKEDRAYYAIPYKKRHAMHVLRVWKRKILNRIR